jgi:hypothetical protein
MFNIHIIGAPRERRKSGAERVFEEITAELFTIFSKDIDLQI